MFRRIFNTRNPARALFGTAVIIGSGLVYDSISNQQFFARFDAGEQEQERNSSLDFPVKPNYFEEKFKHQGGIKVILRQKDLP